MQQLVNVERRWEEEAFRQIFGIETSKRASVDVNTSDLELVLQKRRKSLLGRSVAAEATGDLMQF